MGLVNNLLGQFETLRRTVINSNPDLKRIEKLLGEIFEHNDTILKMTQTIKEKGIKVKRWDELTKEQKEFFRTEKENFIKIVDMIYDLEDQVQYHISQLAKDNSIFLSFVVDTYIKYRWVYNNSIQFYTAALNKTSKMAEHERQKWVDSLVRGTIDGGGFSPPSGGKGGSSFNLN